MKLEENIYCDAGQSILEFVLLLSIILGLSIVLAGGLNGQISKRWRALVYIISMPSDTKIEVR